MNTLLPLLYASHLLNNALFILDYPVSYLLHNDLSKPFYIVFATLYFQAILYFFPLLDIEFYCQFIRIYIISSA